MKSDTPAMALAVSPWRRLSGTLAARRGCAFDLTLLAAVSVLVRLPWVIFMRHGLIWDSTYYYYSAKSIAVGHGYAILGHPTAFFPVGWPAFLAFFFAITGPSIWTILVLNVILWTVTVGLVYALGRRMGGRATGVVAALIIAISPTLTLYVLRAYSEALFIPLLIVVGLLLTARRESPGLPVAALAGIVLGLAILVRSTAAPLAFLLGLWLFLRNPWRASWRPAVIFAALACLVVAPWVVRNQVLMHSPVLSTNGGYTLWVGNHLPPPAFKHPIHLWGIGSVRAEVHQNSTMTADSLRFMVRHTGTWLARVPHKFLTLMGWNTAPLKNALRFQHQPDPRGNYTYLHPAQLQGTEGTLVRAVLGNTWIFRAWHYTFWLLGGLAMLLALWRRRPAAGFVMLLVAFWIILHSVVFFGDVRFMVSVTPLVAAPLAWLLVQAACGARRLAHLISESS